MTKTREGIVWAGATVLAAVTAVPIATTSVPVAGLIGGGLTASLGCVVCAGAGVYALLSGAGLAAILWTETAFAAGTACIGVCAAALSL
jgi:hypothetical protein